MVQLKKKHPSEGWIPGKHAADEKLFRRLEELRAKIQELENEKISLNTKPPKNIEKLAQGDETFSQPCELIDKNGKKTEIDLEASWDDIFAYAGSVMIGECTEDEFEDKIKLLYYHSIPEEYKAYNSYENVVIYYVVFDAIKIQLQALGLITYGDKRRTVSDKNTYWKLTPYGEKYLLKVRAIESSTF
jgi:hypothetical protein